jgi:hypothetical protein
MTYDELLDINNLMQIPDRAVNHKRQLHAHALFRAARLERDRRNRELADRLKAAGNRLVWRNFEINTRRYPEER